jgi:hypothetical protein
MYHAAATLLLLAAPPAAEPARTPLAYAPAPVANPLKGLVPYAGEGADRFPHTLEFDYVPLADLQTGYDSFDWKPLEKLLDAVAGRGHQAVVRVYLEYPGRKNAVPKFLLDAGLKVHKYKNTTENPPVDAETPDYADKNLRRAVRSFVAAFGEKYDRDPRIGFITAGLLGAWGEWHTYPKEDLFAPEAVQAEVMDAYEAAFKVTPVLLRYPVGPKEPGKAANAARPFGYHDDSFAWATLHTGKDDDDWFYMTALKGAGAAAEEKWKTHPIGGEIRPEAWGQVFDPKPANPRVQNFRACVEATHATWLMDSGLFEKKPTAARVKRAADEVRRMGYEFHAPGVTVGPVADGKLPVSLELENRGVAPFYYDWKAEYGLLADGKVVRAFPAAGKLTGLLPGGKARVWADALDVSAVPAGTYTLAVRVPNPLPKGAPVRFANTTQDRDVPGWLSLTAVAR